MPIRILRFSLILSLLPAALAAQEPFNHIARYEFDWNDLPLGRVAIESKETPESYSMHTLIKSRGMVSLFAKHSSDSSVTGKRNAERYFPTLYETNYQTRKKPKHIKITSDGEGHILQEVDEPADSDRPKIPEVEKAKAADLLTCIYLIRQGLANAQLVGARVPLKNGKPFYDIDMYDGKRISHLSFEVVGKENHRVNWKKRASIHIRASRSPGPGYTPKELGRLKDEPSMDIYFSDDAKLVPLAMEVHYLGTIRGQLVQECKTLQECF